MTEDRPRLEAIPGEADHVDQVMRKRAFLAAHPGAARHGPPDPLPARGPGPKPRAGHPDREPYLIHAEPLVPGTDTGPVPGAKERPYLLRRDARPPSGTVQNGSDEEGKADG